MAPDPGRGDVARVERHARDTYGAPPGTLDWGHGDDGRPFRVARGRTGLAGLRRGVLERWVAPVGAVGGPRLLAVDPHHAVARSRVARRRVRGLPIAPAGRERCGWRSGHAGRARGFRAHVLGTEVVRAALVPGGQRGVRRGGAGRSGLVGRGRPPPRGVERRGHPPPAGFAPAPPPVRARPPDRRDRRARRWASRPLRRPPVLSASRRLRRQGDE